MTTRLLQLLPEQGDPQQLMILMHGVGSTADDLVPLVQRLRGQFSQAAFLLPDGFEPFDGGFGGRQWFSVMGVTEDSRVERVAAALPRLVAWIGEQQRRLGVGAAATALFGFSQGSIMALETACAEPALVGRVVAFAGRFARLPAQAPRLTTFHLLHGADDGVIPARHAQEAFEQLSALEGGDATLDIADGVGHELPEVLIERALFRLTHHIPVRLWQEALGARAPGPDGEADDATENR